MATEWHISVIEIPDKDAEYASYLLYELGCNGVMEETAGREGFVKLTAYYDSILFDREDLEKRVQDSLVSARIETEKVDMITSAVDDWKERWRQWFKAFEIVPGIVVAPSWENYTAKSNEAVITLDPGMAFGTGLHATTKLCAEAISYLHNNFSNPTLLDVGTGSGMLAIVGRKLEIEGIVTVENDPDAKQIAEENFEKNDVSEIEVLTDINDVEGTFDIVVANILLSTLTELKEGLIRTTAPDGFLILSGITHDQEREIKETFGSDLIFIDSKRMDEWSIIIFKK